MFINKKIYIQIQLQKQTNKKKRRSKNKFIQQIFDEIRKNFPL